MNFHVRSWEISKPGTGGRCCFAVANLTSLSGGRPDNEQNSEDVRPRTIAPPKSRPCRGPERGRDTMIDLSYLTEEEQEMIMTVLQRDAKLKKAEGDRVKQLQRLPKARGKIKYMTGEWFYEAKSQRHMDRIHGSDIIRASMKQKNPMSLFNFTQSWKARTRAVSNGNQEILSTPEPLQLYEEPPMQPEEER